MTNMIRGADVLEMLLPNGGWVIYGNDYESIKFLECEPITKKQFEDGFAQYNALKTQEAEEKEAARQAILDRLGLNADEVKLLLG